MFEILYIDPPWQYKPEITLIHVLAGHGGYGTMTYNKLQHSGR